MQATGWIPEGAASGVPVEILEAVTADTSPNY